MKGKIVYKESQSFMFTWTWFVAVGVGIIALGLLFFQVITGYSLDSATDVGVKGNGEMIIVSIVTLLVITGVIIFLSLQKLEIQVDDGTLRYKFFPYFFDYKTISKNKVSALYVRKYKPILEYGGWGYRWRFRKGKAFTIRGKWGLQIEFSSGKKLLLGTQQPVELDKAIDQLRKNWDMR